MLSFQVVTEKTELPGELVATSSFGFGGANVHILLRRNMYKKKRQLKDGMPRLIVLSGRTEEGTRKTMSKVRRQIE